MFTVKFLVQTNETRYAYLAKVNRDVGNGIRTFRLDILPLPNNFPSILHGVGHSPFHHHHPPIYNIKRSTVNVYKLIAADRLRSEVRVGASLQKNFRPRGSVRVRSMS